MKKIEDLVLQLRAQLGIPDDTLPDLRDVLRRLKIAGIISDFGPGSDVLLADRQAVWNRADRAILLSNNLWEQLDNTAETEVRFTVFHEIGHAVLGHTARNRMTQGKYQFGSSIEFDEAEADDFARAFAIPLNFVSTVDLTDTHKLAAQFGLSIKMVERRLIELQRHDRKSNKPRQLEQTAEEDNYAEAMAAMKINALAWNA